ncbi:MAG: hypothetical protein AMK72_04400 [Planctomycetes bacterium SM23_25]|nr:MAG: hypothetical protein AMK72_04400 [Planctomycetes bacterium SM23_25]
MFEGSETATVRRSRTRKSGRTPCFWINAAGREPRTAGSTSCRVRRANGTPQAVATADRTCSWAA